MNRSALLLPLLALLGCNSSDPGTGGAAGTGSGSSVATSGSTATHASSAAVGSTSSSASSTDAATSSSSGCVPTPCPANMCGEVRDGCGNWAQCSLVCGFGTECDGANACAPCQNAATCQSCYPTAAQVKAACEANTPSLQPTCEPVIVETVQCVPPQGASYIADCSWSPNGTEECAPVAGHICWDVYGQHVCPNSAEQPN